MKYRWVAVSLEQQQWRKSYSCVSLCILRRGVLIYYFLLMILSAYHHDTCDISKSRAVRQKQSYSMTNLLHKWVCHVIRAQLLHVRTQLEPLLLLFSTKKTPWWWACFLVNFQSCKFIKIQERCWKMKIRYSILQVDIVSSRKYCDLMSIASGEHTTNFMYISFKVFPSFTSNGYFLESS